MHRLHVALMDLDGHRIGNRAAQLLADGSLRVCEKLLPELRVQRGLLDNPLKYFIALRFSWQFSPLKAGHGRRLAIEAHHGPKAVSLSRFSAKIEC